MDMLGDTWWWPFAFILLVGWLPSDLWRVVGTYAAGFIDPDGIWLDAVKAVANALVAAVIARLIFFPVGVLADYPLWLRLGAFAVAVAVYLAVGKRLFVGIATGIALLLVIGLYS